jgi:hypothetical protein
MLGMEDFAGENSPTILYNRNSRQAIAHKKLGFDR